MLLTHNYSYEVLAATGELPEDGANNFRNDVKFISEAASEASWLDDYTFPLYNVDDDRLTPLKRVSRIVRPKKKIVDKETSRLLNRESLHKAARYVAQGGFVLMCPEGTRDKRDSFRTGIALMLKYIEELADKDREVYIIMSSVEGINVACYIKDKVMRFLPQDLRSPYRKASVRYSKPIPLSSLNIRGKERSEITIQIEKLYREWESGSLTSVTK